MQRHPVDKRAVLAVRKIGISSLVSHAGQVEASDNALFKYIHVQVDIRYDMCRRGPESRQLASFAMTTEPES
jgi:hypothetical protein